MREAQVEKRAEAGPSPSLTYALLAMLCMVWGSTWLVIKLGLRDIPPFTAASARFLVAGLLMLLVARRFAGVEGGGRPPRLVVLAHGLCQFGFNFGIVYVAETVIPSGLVAVLWSVFPLFIALGSHFVLRTERLSGGAWLGILLSFSGVATLFATDLADVDARALKMGFWVLLAPLSVSVSTLLIKQRASGSSSMLLNRDAMLIGASALGLVACLVESPSHVHWTQAAVLSVLYLAAIGSVLTFGTYFWLLRYVPAYRMSLVSFVLPVVALLMGAAFGGEPLGVRTLSGTGLVLAGVSLVLRKKRA
jgi:drug/metabolite transporter (DMT)-like permease